MKPKVVADELTRAARWIEHNADRVLSYVELPSGAGGGPSTSGQPKRPTEGAALRPMSDPLLRRQLEAVGIMAKLHADATRLVDLLVALDHDVTARTEGERTPCGCGDAECTRDADPGRRGMAEACYRKARRAAGAR